MDSKNVKIVKMEKLFKMFIFEGQKKEKFCPGGAVMRKI
jgi:hypothetical protein